MRKKTQNLSNLPTVTQLISTKTRLKPYWPPEPTLHCLLPDGRFSNDQRELPFFVFHLDASSTLSLTCSLFPFSSLCPLLKIICPKQWRNKIISLKSLVNNQGVLIKNSIFLREEKVSEAWRRTLLDLELQHPTDPLWEAETSLDFLSQREHTYTYTHEICIPYQEACEFPESHLLIPGLGKRGENIPGRGHSTGPHRKVRGTICWMLITIA